MPGLRAPGQFQAGEAQGRLSASRAGNLAIGEQVHGHDSGQGTRQLGFHSRYLAGIAKRLGHIGLLGEAIDTVLNLLEVLIQAQGSGICFQGFQ